MRTSISVKPPAARDRLHPRLNDPLRLANQACPAPLRPTSIAFGSHSDCLLRKRKKRKNSFPTAEQLEWFFWILGGECHIPADKKSAVDADFSGNS
jgi:hypothetical protein